MDMSLDTIKKLADELGNEDLKLAVKSTEDSIRANLDKISTLELDRNSAIEKRDRQAKLVKSTFGIDELTEENLKKFAMGDKEPDSVLKAEVDKMTSMTEMLKAEKDSLSKKYSETVNRYKVEKSLASLGAIEDTENQRAYDILLNEVTSGAEFDEEGNLVFKANDGTTVRNSDGSPMSLSDRYSQVKDSDDFQFLFKTKRSKSGSGSGGSKGGNAQGITSLKGLNDVERTRLFKQDPTLFRELLNKG
jgi:hypothetical protein